MGGEVVNLDTLLVNLLAQAPAAVAVIIVVIKFLHFLKCERTSRASVLTERHREFFKELERGRELVEQVRKTIEKNTEQSARTGVIMEQTHLTLKTLNGGATVGDS